jgi:Pentapeptide repeats (8 copies)
LGVRKNTQFRQVLFASSGNRKLQKEFDEMPLTRFKHLVSIAAATLLTLSWINGIWFGVAGASSSPTTTTTTAEPTNGSQISYMWSIVGGKGSLKGSSDSNLTLTLSDSPIYLTRFTDRPLREAFVVANQNFIHRWNQYFAASGPNADLAYTPPGSSQPRNIIVSISKPAWNASQKTWTFHAQRIARQVNNIPGTIKIEPPRFPNPPSFTNATLFIDSGGVCADANAPGDAAPSVDWSNCNLFNAQLIRANLMSANLSNTNLSDSMLYSTALVFSNLSYSNLSYSDMDQAYLGGANLSFANLTGAYLSGAQGLNQATYYYTTCPDGTDSNFDGNTCINNLDPEPAPWWYYNENPPA